MTMSFERQSAEARPLALRVTGRVIAAYRKAKALLADSEAVFLTSKSRARHLAAKDGEDEEASLNVAEFGRWLDACRDAVLAAEMHLAGCILVMNGDLDRPCRIVDPGRTFEGSAVDLDGKTIYVAAPPDDQCKTPRLVVVEHFDTPHFGNPRGQLNPLPCR